MTLTIDPKVAERAKRYAKERGVSVSKLVEEYLDDVTHRPVPNPDTPILNRLRGSLKGVDIDDYYRHLEEKHG